MISPCLRSCQVNDGTPNVLVYANFCPVGLDGVTSWVLQQINAGVPAATYEVNPFFYEYFQQCQDGNGYAGDPRLPIRWVLARAPALGLMV